MDNVTLILFPQDLALCDTQQQFCMLVFCNQYYLKENQLLISPLKLVLSLKLDSPLEHLGKTKTKPTSLKSYKHRGKE